MRREDEARDEKAPRRNTVGVQPQRLFRQVSLRSWISLIAS